MDRGAWRATVHRIAKCRTQLSEHNRALVSLEVSRFWSRPLAPGEGPTQGLEGSVLSQGICINAISLCTPPSVSHSHPNPRISGFLVNLWEFRGAVLQQGIDWSNCLFRGWTLDLGLISTGALTSHKATHLTLCNFCWLCSYHPRRPPFQLQRRSRRHNRTEGNPISSRLLWRPEICNLAGK